MLIAQTFMHLGIFHSVISIRAVEAYRIILIMIICNPTAGCCQVKPENENNASQHVLSICAMNLISCVMSAVTPLLCKTVRCITAHVQTHHHNDVARNPWSNVSSVLRDSLATVEEHPEPFEKIALRSVTLLAWRIHPRSVNCPRIQDVHNLT